MGLDVSKIALKASSVISQGSKTIAKTASNIQEAAPEKLTGALDALASAKQTLVKKGKIGTVNNTVEALTKDAIKHGVNPKEAQKGAKAVVSVTGGLSGKSAKESAKAFLKAEKNKLQFTEADREALVKTRQESQQLQKTINGHKDITKTMSSDEKLSQIERKQILKEKYGIKANYRREKLLSVIRDFQYKNYGWGANGFIEGKKITKLTDTQLLKYIKQNNIPFEF